MNKTTNKMYLGGSTAVKLLKAAAVSLLSLSLITACATEDNSGSGGGNGRGNSASTITYLSSLKNTKWEYVQSDIYDSNCTVKHYTPPVDPIDPPAPPSSECTHTQRKVLKSGPTAGTDPETSEDVGKYVVYIDNDFNFVYAEYKYKLIHSAATYNKYTYTIYDDCSKGIHPSSLMADDVEEIVYTKKSENSISDKTINPLYSGTVTENSERKIHFNVLYQYRDNHIYPDRKSWYYDPSNISLPGLPDFSDVSKSTSDLRLITKQTFSKCCLDLKALNDKACSTSLVHEEYENWNKTSFDVTSNIASQKALYNALKTKSFAYSSNTETFILEVISDQKVRVTEAKKFTGSNKYLTRNSNEYNYSYTDNLLIIKMPSGTSDYKLIKVNMPGYTLPECETDFKIIPDSSPSIFDQIENYCLSTITISKNSALTLDQIEDYINPLVQQCNKTSTSLEVLIDKSKTIGDIVNSIKVKRGYDLQLSDPEKNYLFVGEQPVSEAPKIQIKLMKSSTSFVVTFQTEPPAPCAYANPDEFEVTNSGATRVSILVTPDTTPFEFFGGIYTDYKLVLNNQTLAFTSFGNLNIYRPCTITVKYEPGYENSKGGSNPGQGGEGNNPDSDGVKLVIGQDIPAEIWNSISPFLIEGTDYTINGNTITLTNSGVEKMGSLQGGGLTPDPVSYYLTIGQDITFDEWLHLTSYNLTFGSDYTPTDNENTFLLTESGAEKIGLTSINGLEKIIYGSWRFITKPENVGLEKENTAINEMINADLGVAATLKILSADDLKYTQLSDGIGYIQSGKKTTTSVNYTEAKAILELNINKANYKVSIKESGTTAKPSDPENRWFIIKNSSDETVAIVDNISDSSQNYISFTGIEPDTYKIYMNAARIWSIVITEFN